MARRGMAVVRVLAREYHEDSAVSGKQNQYQGTFAMLSTYADVTAKTSCLFSAVALDRRKANIAVLRNTAVFCTYSLASWILLRT